MGVCGENMDGWTLSLSLFLSLSLSHCKDKNKFSTPSYSSDPWKKDCIWRWCWTGSEKWNYMHHVQTENEKKTKMSSWNTVGSLRSIISTITWRLYVTILWFIMLWTKTRSMEGEQLWGGGKAGFLDIRRSAHSTKLCSVEELREGRKYIMWHLCIWETFCWDLDSVCTENVLQWEKKLHTYGNSLKIGGEISSFFKMLIVIVHACLSREEDYVCHSFLNGKEATVAV